MMVFRRSPLLAGLLVAPLAIAQQAELVEDVPTSDAQAQPESPVVLRQVPTRQPISANLPPFESLVVRGEDGKVIRIDAQLDLLALQRNTLVDDATRERIRPILREWLADLDQLVIDNLDFIERIDPPDGSPGVIKSIDLNDHATVQPVATMMNQLISAGPLTAHLQTRGALTREQHDLNQRIISDYLQAVMNEVLAEHNLQPGGQQPRSEEERTLQVNTVSRHLYGLSSRDAMAAYYRQLADAAPYAEQIVAVTGLPSETSQRLRPHVEQARNAQTELERRSAVRELLNHLSFEERREFLQRALEVVPEQDLLAPNPA
jgi:hypothetical protein